MDILKDKQTKSYDYISRYTSFPFYYNTRDRKYVYGLLTHLNKNVPYVAHKVAEKDTLDYLAYKYYGRPDLYWVIADFNGILDAFCRIQDKYTVLKIPSISSIHFD